MHVTASFSSPRRSRFRETLGNPLETRIPQA
jgi:hypothetical protein